MANLYNQTVKETLATFKTDPDRGLTSHEVQNRQAKYGKNTLKVKTTPLWRKILEPFTDIFMIILLVALVLSAIQGEWIEVGLIAVIMAVDAVIYYIQQFSTERILRSLRAQTVHTVTVLRDGTEQGIDASELVPGDIVILSEGDRIPADGRILVESGILTNEAMLTGESEPVAKDAKAISGTKKIYEQRNMVFSGSFIFTGSGKMVVSATGNNTEYGRIASLASSVETSSPIEQKINKLIIQIAVIVVALAIIILIIQLINGIDLLDSLKFTLAMIVSAVPEGLPVAIAIILALGARRMAKKKALIKEMRAIESIGIVTTIASDKTGTLTKNKLSLRDIWSPTPNKDFIKSVAESALLPTAATDPLDTAIWDYLKAHHPHLTDIGPVHSYPFDQKLKLSGNLYETKTGQLHLVIKGAPEAVLARCQAVSTTTRVQIDEKISEMSLKGYKVIAIATARLKHEINELTRLDNKQVVHFAGLIAIADSIRREAPSAIRQAKRAGVQVKMITGDHAQTAYAIGAELGLTTNPEQVFDCSKMGNISDDDLVEAVKTATVFARVTPEDKFRLITAIKQTEISAMTGDGVNDVPAITNAHIGIAMGNSPSIVQDAGDIILLDNNFRNIIEAMKEGRIVLANIRRMLVYLLATNTGEVLTIIGAFLIGGTQLLLPIQILWVNLVTDSLLVIPIGLEPAENYFLHQKPESKDAPILSPILIIRMVLIALIMAVVTLGTYFVANSSLTHDQANTLAFTALVVVQWANALTTRGTAESLFRRLRVKHLSLWLALSCAIALQLLVTFGPLSGLVHVVAVPFDAFIITVLIAFFSPIIIIELYKKIANHFHTK